MVARLHDLRPYVLSIMRVVVGLLFMQHGLGKVLGMFGSTPAEAPLLVAAGWLELVGGALILVGLLTRPVAFVLSGQMAVAYFMAHFPQGFWPMVNKGELAVLYSFVFLYMVFSGAGPLSLDALFARRDERATIPLDDRALAGT